MTPISVQLYSLREASTTDFDGVLRDVASIGYRGVEPFNLFGKSPAAFKRQVDDLGMTISSSHFPWATRTGVPEIVDVLGGLGLSRAIGGYAPDDFASPEAIQRIADATQQLLEALAAQGITLALHNHYWEYALIDGQPAYYQFQDLVPEVEFQIDAYWAANFGARDPAAEVARVRERAPLLHIKDGPLVEGASHVAVGSGTMNIPEVIAAGDPNVLEWLVVELDKCDTDMLTAVRESYTYLTGNGLAAGRG